MSKAVLFQIIQFCMSTLLSSIWPVDRTLSLWARMDLGVIAIKGYSAFPQSSSITGTSSSDCLVSYPAHLLWRGVLPFCREVVGWLCKNAKDIKRYTMVKTSTIWKEEYKRYYDQWKTQWNKIIECQRDTSKVKLCLFYGTTW